MPDGFKNDSKVVHFLQIWCKPNKAKLQPAYTTKAFSDEAKTDKLALVVEDISSENAQSVVPINADLSMYASILSPEKALIHNIQRDSAYIHLIMTSGYKTPQESAKIEVNGEVLSEGDGLFVRGTGELNIKSVGSAKAEFLLFDIKQ